MAGIYMRFPGGKSKAFTLSYDDGFEPDLRLMKILKKYHLKGTFNLNSGMFGQDYTVYYLNRTYRRLDREQVTKLYADSGMEVAVHGLTHAGLTEIPENLRIMEVLNDRLNLEKQFGRIVRGMAYAGGGYNDSVIDSLKTCGIVYARTTTSTGDFRLPSDWYRLTATCHQEDERLMDFAHRFTEETVRKTARLFYVWGHSYELEAGNEWEHIEEFAKYMSGREDIWYATNLEIHDYVEAYRSLVFSTDSSLVHNPTATEVFFIMDGQNIRIAPGETMQLYQG